MEDRQPIATQAILDALSCIFGFVFSVPLWQLFGSWPRRAKETVECSGKQEPGIIHRQRGHLHGSQAHVDGRPQIAIIDGAEDTTLSSRKHMPRGVDFERIDAKAG